MLRKMLYGWLILGFLIVSCSDKSDEMVPITEYFPFNKSYSWTYQFISFDDTSSYFMDFDLSQLSEDEDLALLEIYNLEFSGILAVASSEGGMCLSLLDISLEEAKVNINSLEVDCEVFLKYPVQPGDNYTYEYQDEAKKYEYDITIALETTTVEAGTFEVYKYEFKSGNPSDPNIAVLYFNPEVGMIKYYPELRSDSESNRGFTLTEVK